MYIIRRKISGRVREYLYYSEPEAIANRVDYHSNPRASFLNNEIKVNDHILTIEGLVVPVIKVTKTDLHIPTNIITSISNTQKPFTIKGKNGFKFSIADAGGQRYTNEIKNIVDVFLANGFNHVDAVNTVLGELKHKRGGYEERKRANKIFSRGETQEYLRMAALEHFRKAGIDPGDILQKMFEGLEAAVEDRNYEAIDNLGTKMLTASGEFDTDSRPVNNVNILNNYPQLPEETDTVPIGLIDQKHGENEDDVESEI